MQLPKLTPLQSRLLASAIATCFVVVLWITFQPNHFVYAAELPLVPEDLESSQYGQTIPHPPRDDATALLNLGREDSEEGSAAGLGYVPDFAYLDHNLVGRQQEVVEKLTNNVKREMDADPGSVKHFVLEKSQLRAKRAETGFSAPLNAPGENVSGRGTDDSTDASGFDQQEDGALGGSLHTRQDVNRVWISANTCRLPQPEAGVLQTSDPLQMTLYVSTSTNNQEPGPDKTNDLASPPIPFVGGYANFSLQTDSDVYVGISSPSLSVGWEGNYRLEVAVSVDGYYHGYNESETFLFMIDTDSESTLFITPNLTTTNNSADVQRWMDMNPVPFTMYAFPENGSWSRTMGLERSICGLREQFNASTKFTVDSFMTTKFGDSRPKGQFHVQGLNEGTTYFGFLAVDGSNAGLELPGVGTVRAGGEVFKQFQWTTKELDSCQVLFDLEFCSDVAYAVPSSLQFKFNDTGLKAMYDTQAKEYFDNFEKSLQQVACDTTATAQYSLARTCNDCRNDYKAWLCSVLIPRCEDWNANDTWLHKRNVMAPFANGSFVWEVEDISDREKWDRDMGQRLGFNQSRNPMIDKDISPGPYKELLPCEDMCFDIVRSCPAQLGFSCPNAPARNKAYGRRDESRPNDLTCNFPGAVVKLNVDRGAAGSVGARIGAVALAAGLAGLVLWL